MLWVQCAVWDRGLKGPVGSTGSTGTTRFRNEPVHARYRQGAPDGQIGIFIGVLSRLSAHSVPAVKTHLKGKSQWRFRAGRGLH
ncbi:unnamed protein product [Danaus chrysippus]|uniref:(African queen) hypothetical protein n=1 Tax=Danaus chrysippus TaxID=151541 RepID=A0A8J2QT69_9NEOP|nr:unnamed protein product [Danaus chrysippus]